MIIRHGAGRSLHGLSGIGNVRGRRDIPELCALLCGCVNSNGILCNQEHPLLNQRGFLMFLSTFLINMGSLCSLSPSLFLSFFFFFCGFWICL